MRIKKSIGNYSKKRAEKYLKLGLLSLIPFTILFLTSVTWLPTYINVGGFETLRGLLAGIWITLSAIYLWEPFYAWKNGLEGEALVVRNLSNKLGNEYAIFNDVLLKDGKKGNIDHIVVGPTGIFVIETKSNSGTVVFDNYIWKRGVSGNPSQQVLVNALRIKDILKNCEVSDDIEPYVDAILLFSNPKARLQLYGNPKNCSVIQIKSENDTKLSEFIINRISLFSTQQIDLIEKCLKSKISNYEE